MKATINAVLLITLSAAASAANAAPNLVLIVTDDLGYGDVGCYGGKAIPTPRIDRMAAEGIRMNRCYAPASTCTPTRFAIMTGQYAWRPTKRKTTVLDGDAPLAIAPGRPTLPAILAEAGYDTALVGKWHLGIGDGDTPIDFNGHVGPGPIEVGFREAFYIPATVDRVPCVFVDNHAVANLDPNDPIRISYREKVGDEPTGIERPDLLKYGADDQHAGTIINGISRIGFMAGGASARWIDQDITDVLAKRASDYIRRQRDKPFFLMLGTHDPHVPHDPHPRFIGASDAGIRGDAIVQADWLVGTVLDALAAAGIEDQTLVIVTSDNGPTIFDGYFDGSVAASRDHAAAGRLRGGKYLVYEGGCRVPCIVRWPGTIPAGVSEARFSLIDLLPSLASIAEIDELPLGIGRDGVDRSAMLLDPNAESDDEPLILQGVRNARALIAGDWKFIPSNAGSSPSGLGRGADPRDTRFAEATVHEDTLLDLSADPSETTNVIAQHLEKAEALRALLATIAEND